MTAKATATSKRTSLGVPMSPEIVEFIRAEVIVTGITTSQLIRRIIWWHRGTGLPRHSESHAVSWARKPGTKTVRTVMLDSEDIDYLDYLASTILIARSTVMQMLIMQWFDLEALPPAKRAQAE